MNRNLMNVIKIWINRILVILFPLNCLGCGHLDASICNKCLYKIKIIENDECPFCEQIGTLGICCDECNEKHFLDGLFYINYYSSKNLLTKTIWKFKFQGIIDFAYPLAWLLKQRLELLKKNFKFLNECLYCAVPSNRGKINRRGFNQTEILLKFMDINPTNYKSLLSCKTFSKEQKNLNSQQRKENIKEKFQVKHLLKGEIIILIDDVATTLATLEEIARILKNAGARKVYGLTLLRQKLYYKN